MTDPWASVFQTLQAPKPAAYGGSRGSVTPDYIVDGLVQRGLAPAVAEGFAMNAADESGFNPGINEAAPTVAGSRGGFGLFQWTGPRRRELEAFAAQRGASVADPDLQLDFLMTELSGSERAAASSILGAQTAGEAGAAIVNDFLRPAESHRRSRAAKYMGGFTPSAPRGAAQAPVGRLWLDLGAPQAAQPQAPVGRLWLDGVAA